MINGGYSETPDNWIERTSEDCFGYKCSECGSDPCECNQEDDDENDDDEEKTPWTK